MMSPGREAPRAKGCHLSDRQTREPGIPYPDFVFERFDLEAQRDDKKNKSPRSKNTMIHDHGLGIQSSAEAKGEVNERAAAATINLMDNTTR